MFAERLLQERRNFFCLWFDASSYCFRRPFRSVPWVRYATTVGTIAIWVTTMAIMNYIATEFGL